MATHFAFVQVSLRAEGMSSASAQTRELVLPSISMDPKQPEMPWKNIQVPAHGEGPAEMYWEQPCDSSYLFIWL